MRRLIPILLVLTVVLPARAWAMEFCRPCFEPRKAVFLLAKTLAEHQDPAAPAWLRRARQEVPELADYILFYETEFFSARGDWTAATRASQTILQDYPDSALILQSHDGLAEALLQAGEAREAREVSTLIARLYPDEPLGIAAQFRVAASLEQEGQTKAAAVAYRQFWLEHPASELAGTAEERQTALAAQGTPLPFPTGAERWARAQRLARVGAHEQVVVALRSLLAEEPDASFTWEAVLQLVRSTTRLRRDLEARDLLLQLMREDLPPDVFAEALSWFARIAVRQDDLDGLLTATRLLQELESPRRAESLLFLALSYADRYAFDQAYVAFRELVSAYPDGPEAEKAQWWLGWHLYKVGRYQEAAETWEGFLRTHPDTVFRPQLLYWAARVRERLGDAAAVVRHLRLLCRAYRYTYYCDQATRMLSRLDEPVLIGVVETSAGPVADTSQDPDDPLYRAAILLHLAGLDQEAERALSRLMTRTTDRRHVVRLVETFREIGADPQAIRAALAHFRDALRRERIALPAGVWQGAFPTSYLGLLRRETRGVDPLLLLALIREESSFDPDAISKSGALGLMQLMPATADWTAKQLKLPDERRRSLSLLEPETNILLGTAYYHHLVDRFEGDSILAVAAYNAGPQVVARWWATRELSEPDEFVEDIPFRETRWYVKRVLRSYAEYLRLARAGFLDTP